MDILIGHVLLVANQQIFVAKDVFDCISFILRYNLKVNQIQLENKVFHFYNLLLGSLSVAQKVLFLGLLRESVVVDYIPENGSAVVDVLVLLLENALTKFKDDA